MSGQRTVVNELTNKFKGLISVLWGIVMSESIPLFSFNLWGKQCHPPRKSEALPH